MTPKKHHLEMAVVSVVFIVLALVGVVATFTSGLLGAGIDGIMLISICLVVVLAFTIELFMLALDAGWIKLPAKSSPAKSSTAKAAAPATASPAK